MKVIRITPDNMEAFRNYIIPEVYAAMEIERGEKHTALGLVEKHFTVGAVCGEFTGVDEFLIKSLYVDENMRMYGGGSELLSSLISELSGRAETIKISYSAKGADEDAFCALLAKTGFSAPEKKSDIFYIKGSSIRGTALFPDKPAARDSNIAPLYSLPEDILEPLDEDENVPSYLSYTLDEKTADRDGSLAYLKDGRVAAYVIFKPVEQHILALTAAYTEKGSAGLFLKLIPECVRTLVDKYGAETICVISAITPRVAALIEKLSEGNIENRYTEYSSEYKSAK